MKKRTMGLYGRLALQITPVAVLVLLVVGHIIVNRMTSSLLEVVQTRHQAQHQAVETELKRKIETLKLSIAHLAANDMLINALIDATGKDEHLALFFRSLRIPGSETAQISLQDYKGRGIVSNQMVNPSYLGAPFWEAVSRGKDHFELTPQRLLYAVPILYHGLMEGAIVLSCGNDQFSRMFHVMADIDGMALYNANGQSLFTPSPVFYEKPMPEALGKGWLTIKKPIEDLDGLVLETAVSKKKALAPVQRVKKFLVLATILNITVLLLCIIWLSRLVVRPVSNFVKNLDRIRQSGKLTALEQKPAPREIQNMADAFNHLVDQLQASMISRTYLNRMIDSMTEGVFTTSLEGRINAANPSFYKLMGFPADQVLEKPMERFFSRPIVEDILKDVQKDGSTSGREIIVRNNRWEERFILHACAMMPADQSARMEVVHVVHDITDRKYMEIALREQQERLELVIKGTNVGLWDWYIQTGQTVFNERWAEIVGYTLDELAPVSIDTWVKLAHPEDLKQSNALLAKHFAGELEFYDFECRMQHKNGSWVWVHDRGKVVEWDESGKPLRISGTHTDVTKRKRMEESLRESETNFRTFFESIGDIIVVGDSSGKIVYTNPNATRKLGYSQEDLASMHFLDLHPPENREEADAICNEMFRGERETCPLALLSADGTIVPVETRAWLGKWNGSECIFGISKDLGTEQEAKQRFERLFRNNPTLMALTALPERTFTDVNNAFLSILGYSREEVIGKTSMELGLFVNPERPDAAAEQLLKKGVLADFEMKVSCKDGTLLDGLFSGELISIQGHDHWLTVMIDITARKQAEARLRMAYEAVEQQVREKTQALERQKQIEEQLRHLAVIDGLTGLYNRRYLDVSLQNAFEQCKRYRQDLSLLMLDLDHFKQVNDTFGHDFGDTVLKEFAFRLKNVIRSADIAFRYGGEEFTVLLPHADVSRARVIAERALAACSGKAIAHSECATTVTVSIGAVSYRHHQPSTPKDMLIMADRLLYQAKQNGRNRVETVFKVT